MKKSIRVFGFLLLVGLFVVPSLAFAKKESKPRKAPHFPKNGIWLNQKLHHKKAFKGKLTLVYFWDYAAINSIRDMQVTKNWYEHYHPYGLEMIWVHAPEFNFAFERENVEQAVTRMNITAPVFLDNDFVLWEGFRNRSWPTTHLVNEKGHIVYTKVGEGKLLETEREIQTHLQKLHPSALLPDPIVEKEYDKFDMASCGFMSTETYMGYKRASWWGGEVANKRWMSPDETMMFRDRGDRVEHGFFVQGLWTNREDDLVHARETDGLEDYLGLIYVGHEVFTIASSESEDEESLPVYVTRDDRPVPEEMRGLDLKQDDKGSTYFELKEPRLYYLIQNEDEEAHELRIWTRHSGVSIHSFSFANRCLSEFEHL